MFRLLIILGAVLFLTLLVGGRDVGQKRLGLQGVYDIAALKDAPPPPVEVQETVAAAAPAVVAAAPAATAARPAVQSEPVPGLTQVSFAPTAGNDGEAALNSGLTLSLPPARNQTETDAVVAGTPLPEAPDVAASVGPEGPRVSRVLGSKVNVREEPSAKAAILDRLARDETVTVISTDESGWSLVRIEGDGIEGYVATRYLSDAIDDSALFPAE